jgi:hypothetical protein
MCVRRLAINRISCWPRDWISCSSWLVTYRRACFLPWNSRREVTVVERTRIRAGVLTAITSAMPRQVWAESFASASVHLLGELASCLVDRCDSGTQTGVTIDVWEANGTGARSWSFSSTSGGLYNIAVSHGSYCMTAAHRAAVNLHPCDGSSGQAWQVVAQGGPAQGRRSTLSHPPEGSRGLSRPDDRTVGDDGGYC